VRRYAPIKPSRGTVIPPDIRLKVLLRDKACVGPAVGMITPCQGSIELDHVRASHGMGMKSETTPENLVTLCGLHHRMKTADGRKWRPRLLEYLGR
jgi:5-methylcytosine-specific restriction endonuclease McrA